MVRRVLIADEEAHFCAALKTELEAISAWVETAPDGRAVLQALQTLSIDIAILNWRMARLNAMEVLQTVQRRGIQTDIVMIAGEATVGDAVQAVKNGAKDFLEKPIDMPELVDTICRLLDRRRSSPHYLAHRLDAFLRKHLAQTSLKLNDLCEHFGISARYASRLFCEHIGTPFRQRLVFYRVQQAKSMIESTEEPLYLIAAYCGFKNPCRLSNAFCRLEGISPRKYREVCRGI